MPLSRPGARSPCSQPGTRPDSGAWEAACPTANEAWGQAMKSCSFVQAANEGDRERERENLKLQAGKEVT